MDEEKQKVRCVQCELVQCANYKNCRRCGNVLPTPVVNFVERVVERVVVDQDSQCIESRIGSLPISLWSLVLIQFGAISGRRLNGDERSRSSAIEWLKVP